MHFPRSSLFFLNFHGRKLPVAVLFFLFFPSPQELSHKILFQSTTAADNRHFIDKDTLWVGKENSEPQFPSTHSTVKDLQEMYFNLLLICLRVCLFRGEGNLLTFVS